MRKYKCLKSNYFKKNGFTLIPIRDEDKYDIMKWRNEQLYHLRQENILTPKEQDKYFKEVVSVLFSKNKPDQILFSFLKEDRCIAYGGLVHIDWNSKSAEISFVMDTKLEESFFVKYWIIFLELIEKAAFLDLNFDKIFTHSYDLRPLLYEALKARDFVEEYNSQNRFRYS